MGNLRPCRLANFFDAIWDRPKAKVMSSYANFLGSQVWHVVHLEGSRKKDGSMIH